MPNSLEYIAKRITEGKAHQIVVLVGAGISTASGIPDFRSPRTGLYENLKQFKLPYPEAIFDLAYFRRHPKPFYALAKELYPTGKYRPNVTHYFFKMLHKKALLRRVYTQNIDGLERLAGIPSKKLVEAHGTFATAKCLRCLQPVHTRVVKFSIDQGKVARCQKCQGLVKPDITFFNEELSDSFWRYEKDIPHADLVFVMGTSLEVQPFSNLVFAVRKGVPRVLFNRERVGIFRFTNKKRDHVVLGNISDSVLKLCELLDWKEELISLMEKAELLKVDYLGIHVKNKEICNSNFQQPHLEQSKRRLSSSCRIRMQSVSKYSDRSILTDADRKFESESSDSYDPNETADNTVQSRRPFALSPISSTSLPKKLITLNDTSDSEMKADRETNANDTWRSSLRTKTHVYRRCHSAQCTTESANFDYPDDTDYSVACAENDVTLISATLSESLL